MVMSRKQFHSAIDRYVQGINDPNAPFNQVDDLPKECEECPEEKAEECVELCDTVKEIMAEEYAKQQKADQAQYVHWLKTRHPDICGPCPDLDKCDEPCEKVSDLKYD